MFSTVGKGKGWIVNDGISKIAKRFSKSIRDEGWGVFGLKFSIILYYTVLYCDGGSSLTPWTKDIENQVQYCRTVTQINV